MQLVYYVYMVIVFSCFSFNLLSSVSPLIFLFSAWAKIDKTKEWTDYLSNKHQKFDGILMIYVCGFGLCPLLEAVFYRLLSFGHAGCPLSGVERCPLLGGSKCTVSIGRAIGGHEICPLYRGCPPFGESIIRGFTVYISI